MRSYWRTVCRSCQNLFRNPFEPRRGRDRKARGVSPEYRRRRSLPAAPNDERNGSVRVGYRGHLSCPERSRDGCHIRVFSTPRVPENRADRLRKMIDQCPHGQGA